MAGRSGPSCPARSMRDGGDATMDRPRVSDRAQAAPAVATVGPAYVGSRRRGHRHLVPMLEAPEDVPLVAHPRGGMLNLHPHHLRGEMFGN